jgi:hypothetical protein
VDLLYDCAPAARSDGTEFIWNITGPFQLSETNLDLRTTQLRYLPTMREEKVRRHRRAMFPIPSFLALSIYFLRVRSMRAGHLQIP